MKRFILYLSILFIGLAQFSNAQNITVSLPDTSVTVGANSINIPMLVQNFNNIGAISLKINYNPSVLKFNGISNAPVSGFLANADSVHGVITIAWYSTTPLNFGNGVLLNLNFNFSSGSSPLTFTTAQCEIDDINSAPQVVTYGSGAVSSPIKVSLDNVKASPGDTVTVPLRGFNLSNVGSISLKITYDPTVLQFVNLQSDSVGFTSNASGGTLTLGWYSSNNTPYNLLNGVLAKIVFVYVDNSTPLSFFTFGGQTQLTDINGNVLNASFINGSVNKNIAISLPNLTAKVNTDVDFPVTVTNMSVGSASLKIAYDTTVISFKSATDASNGSFNVNASNGVLTIGYFNTNPTITSGKLWDLIFTYKGGSSALTFDQVQSQITDKNGAIYSGFDFNNGSISLKPNQKPVFTVVLPDTTIAENSLLSFNYKAVDPDSDVVKYSLISPPAGAAIDSLSGKFTWTPAFGLAGTYSIKAVATDGLLSDTSIASVVIVTHTNRKPVFVNVLPDTTIAEAQALNYTYTATDPDTGIYKQVLKFSLVKAPTGATMDTTGKFSWTPSYGQSGTYQVVAVVTDGLLTDTSRTSVVIVNHTNRKPSFVNVLPDTTIAEAQALSYTYTATDPDTGIYKQVLKFSLVKAPAGATMDTTGKFSWTPSYGQASSTPYQIVAVVSDGTLTDTSRTSIVIVSHTNRPPVFTKVMPDTAINENQAFTFTYTAADPDTADTLAYALVKGPTGSALGTKTGTFTWTPDFTQAGGYQVIVSVSDGKVVVKDTANITVNNVDRPPVFTAVLQNTAMKGLDTLIFQYKATDPDAGNVVKYGLVNPPPGAVINNSTGLFRFIAANKDTTVLIIVSASDGTLTTLDTAQVSTTITAIKIVDGLPTEYNLSQNYPNPFNPSTVINFSLPKESKVVLKIYNLLGQEVTTLVNGELAAGNYKYEFNAINLSSGIYIYRIEAGDYSMIKKMTLLK